MNNEVLAVLIKMAFLLDNSKDMSFSEFALLTGYLDEESKKLGFTGYIDAVHNLPANTTSKGVDKTKKLQCDMESTCEDKVTHIDEKGFIYCKSHGHGRKSTMHCRQLKPSELKDIEAGKQIAEY